MANEKDYLNDIVKNTLPIGVELVKITGTDTATSIAAFTPDVSVIVNGKLNTPCPEFKGIFGLPQLGKLNTLLSIPEYKENTAKVKVISSERNGETNPSDLLLENESGDFKNSYRFQDKVLVQEKVKDAEFKGVTWNVEFEPTIVNIQRFKYQQSANSEEVVFKVKTDGSNLVVYFGDRANLSGEFVFQSNVTGTLSKMWAWPIAPVLAILGLTGTKVLKISDMGALQITVDTGLVTYNYILPAHTK